MSSYEDNQKKAQTILERGIGVLAKEYVVRRLDAGEFAGMVTLGTQFNTAHYPVSMIRSVRYMQAKKEQ